MQMSIAKRVASLSCACALFAGATLLASDTPTKAKQEPKSPKSDQSLDNELLKSLGSALLDDLDQPRTKATPDANKKAPDPSLDDQLLDDLGGEDLAKPRRVAGSTDSHRAKNADGGKTANRRASRSPNRRHPAPNPRRAFAIHSAVQGCLQSRGKVQRCRRNPRPEVRQEPRPARPRQPLCQKTVPTNCKSAPRSLAIVAPPPMR